MRLWRKAASDCSFPDQMIHIAFPPQPGAIDELPISSRQKHVELLNSIFSRGDAASRNIKDKEGLDPVRRSLPSTSCSPII